MKPVDVRAGRLCSCCNAPKPRDYRVHCPSPSCPWWKCTRCGADNDELGNNSRADLQGRKKAGGF